MITGGGGVSQKVILNDKWGRGVKTPSKNHGITNEQHPIMGVKSSKVIELTSYSFGHTYRPGKEPYFFIAV